MKLTDDEMWAGIIGCAPTLDGQFLYAVKTIGVYFRPSCKLRMPFAGERSVFRERRRGLWRGVSRVQEVPSG